MSEVARCALVRRVVRVLTRAVHTRAEEKHSAFLTLTNAFACVKNADVGCLLNLPTFARAQQPGAHVGLGRP